MMLLSDILLNVKTESVLGSLDHLVETLIFDSRHANSFSVFFAIKGSSTDGHLFVQQAYAKGCRIFVVQNDISDLFGSTVIKTSDTSALLASMSCNFFDNPSKKLKLIGITGTNGKTTCTSLLYKLFSDLGYKCGLISTVVNKIGSTDIVATHTTPDAVSLNHLLAEMVTENCTHCFMEVSSHAIHQNRILGLSFSGAIFTNITHDHLDYHKTFSEYIRVKKSFFDLLPATSFALVNSDDKNGLIMLQNTLASKQSFALKTPSDFKGKVMENQFTGLIIKINGKEVYSRLVGEFNAYNLLAVYGVSVLLGEDELEVLRTMSLLESVEGRFQYVQSTKGITAIIDYAHTPDALENVLKTINGIRKGAAKVITVIGCGGDRDKSKRPLMAKIACDKSTNVLLTSDNPRTENPESILLEMEAGLDAIEKQKSITIQDRKTAIKTAILFANKGDIILIAGKGHEKYQEIMGIRHDFDDFKITKNMFNELNK
jgi:UDP-N-acetylmuramoyl-L-alanyl-D-glutamate--2,6-diaminopimelate ligase